MASVVGFMQKASAFLCVCHDIGAKIGGNHKIWDINLQKKSRNKWKLSI